MLEIQGDLQIEANPQEENATVRFGQLQIQDKQATLFIGTKQRLLGQLVALDPPLGLMKFDKETQKVQLMDFIEWKVLFKDRPLPIM